MTTRPAAARRIAGWDAGVLVAANAVAVTGLWWRQGGLSEVHDAAGALTSAARLTGLLGALVALVMLLLLARVPVLAGLAGRSRGGLAPPGGVGCVVLLVAHTLLITAGYALQDRVPVAREVGDLLGDYSGVLLATVGLGLLVAVAVTSAAAVRRRHRAARLARDPPDRVRRGRARRSATSSPPGTSSPASRSRARTGGRCTRAWRRDRRRPRRAAGGRARCCATGCTCTP